MLTLGTTKNGHVRTIPWGLVAVEAFVVLLCLGAAFVVVSLGA